MASHKIRMKRGKKRHYPTSSLRRKIKTGMKRRGFSKKDRRRQPEQASVEQHIGEPVQS